MRLWWLPLVFFNNAALADNITPTAVPDPPIIQQIVLPEDSAYAEMILPVVRVMKNDSCYGSAFLTLYNNKEYIITARHLLLDVAEFEKKKVDDKNLTMEKFANQVKIQIISGKLMEEYKTTIAFVSHEHDFAILKLVEIGDQFLPGDMRFKVTIPRFYAKLISDDNYKKLKSFRPVFTVGFPQRSTVPIISSGVCYMSTDGQIGGSAPITGGNSGCPLFDAETHEVIGIEVSTGADSSGRTFHITHATNILYVKEALSKLSPTNPSTLR
jgi:hypothetical protein